ncbi:hypothetical protein [Hymenobacter sp. AT01-02]|uniref:hypothetical protein n=1 Tax=Hymenobacter sp. AT01-02 TaxID=1571877 RepID=UPI00128F9498|nr:hypothetical protein [Hymenobacter sp. AT01-02]
MHYWEVWAGTAPLSDYEKQVPRFMSEYGFQSFPELKSVQQFALPADYDIASPVMKEHQRSAAGNPRLLEYLRRDYKEPKDFASFLYVSQVLQAQAIKIAAEHLRRNRPRVMGSLYWQLDDCWGVASWSSIDYYGRWKALQYYAKRFYEPVLVSPHEEGDNVRVYVVSDRTTLRQLPCKCAYWMLRAARSSARPLPCRYSPCPAKFTLRFRAKSC